MMSLLQIDSLDVRYGPFRAVRGVSLSIAKGEVVALIGANGAGKTTFLRAVAGAVPVAGGRVSLDGEDVTRLPSQARVAKGLALVPEGRRLFQDMTVEENLALGATVRRSGDWQIERVFATFPNLVKRRHARCGLLSGGEQQAVAIGRALMANPEVLILDEVSLGLSPLVVDQVYASLAGLMASGVTIILVEQALARAMVVASRAVCMLEGEIVLDKPMGQVTREEITAAYFGLGRAKRAQA